MPHVVDRDHVDVAGRDDKDVGLGGGFIHRRDLVTRHRRLQGADRVDFGDQHARTLGSEARCRALADVAEENRRPMDRRSIAGESSSRHRTRLSTSGLAQAASCQVDGAGGMIGGRGLLILRRGEPDADQGVGPMNKLANASSSNRHSAAARTTKRVLDR